MLQRVRLAGMVRGLLGAGSIGLAAMLPAGLLVGMPVRALAQEGIKAVEPYVVVVTTDKAPMRCSNGAQLFYSVRDLKSGELLRINGEGPGWLRAEYPAGMRAYVPASDVEPAGDGKTVRLNKPSRLLAVPADGKRPWWPLELDADLPSGTALTLVGEPLKTPDNVVEGYYVAAPAKARGFVKPEHVRKATPEEAAKYIGPATAAPATPAGPGSGTQPGAAPANAGGGEASAVAPAPTADNPAAPGTPPGFNPTTPATTTAPSGEQPVEAPAAAPGETADPAAVRPPPPPPPAASKDQELEEIREMYNRVMASGGDAEVPTVLGMFERKMAKLGDSPRDQQIRQALQQRLEALRLKQDILTELERTRQQSTTRIETMQRVTMIVQEAQRQAIYNIVGRIQPSTVYDGRRGLPLMYRVESADALSPRTVGYIVPTEGIDLLTKVGKVCGVVGESRFDPALQLNIVAPRRIDVLDVGATSTTGDQMTPRSE